MKYTLHNISETVTENDGSVRLFRFPKVVRDSLESETGRNISAFVITGSEIRFVINSGMARLKLYCEIDEMYSPKLQQ